jgi:hypothetical protein
MKQEPNLTNQNQKPKSDAKHFFHHFGALAKKRNPKLLQK